MATCSTRRASWPDRVSRKCSRESRFSARKTPMRTARCCAAARSSSRSSSWWATRRAPTSPRSSPSARVACTSPIRSPGTTKTFRRTRCPAKGGTGWRRSASWAHCSTRSEDLSGPAHPRPPGSSHHCALGRHESELSPGLDHLPPALVHEAVVVIAEGKQVGQVARPAPRPELDVMRGRPVDRPVAARPAAAAVSGSQRPALGRRDGSRRPTDVDHHRVCFQDPAQGAVAGQPLHGLARDRHPRLQLRGRRTQLRLQAFYCRGHGDVRPDPVAAGQLALVHGVVDDLGQGVGAALLGRPAIVLTESLGERVDCGLEGGATFGIDDPAEVVHAIHLADVEEALLVALLGVALEAVRIQRVARVIGEPAQLFDRVLAGKADPLLLVQVLSLLAKLVAQVADHRRRLVGDLPSRYCVCNHRQRLQLLADADPVGGGRYRHAADAADPGSGGDIPVEQVIPRLLCVSGLSGELAFERVDDDPKAFEIYPALLTSLKPAHGRLQCREGCAPFPQHETSVPNICSQVNTLTPKTQFLKLTFSHPSPITTPSSQSVLTLTKG